MSCDPQDELMFPLSLTTSKENSDKLNEALEEEFQRQKIATWDKIYNPKVSSTKGKFPSNLQPPKKKRKR